MTWGKDSVGGSVGALSLGPEEALGPLGQAVGPAPSFAERYTDGPRIGSGGFGRVHSVYDRWLGRDVAFKALHAATGEQEARLVREARITAGLDHPGIVPIYDVGRTPDGRLYYTMRLLHGGTLTQKVAAAASESARLDLVPLVRDAARAVAFAHERGVVHRDVKPDNIMVGPLGDVQVADWGLAQPYPPAVEPASNTPSAPVGTPHYWSPEAAAGLPASPADDVFGFGAVLRDVLRSGETRTATRPHTLGPLTDPTDGPPELLAIANRALAPLGERYPSAREVSDDLTAWMNGKRVRAHAYSPRELTSRFLRAQRVPLLIASAALVATVVGVGLAWRQTAEERNAAITAREHAETTSATLLAREAADADAHDIAPEAAAFAREALAIAADGSDAQLSAVGTRLSTSIYPRVSLLDHAPYPECRSLVPLDDGASWLCLGDNALSRVDAGGVRWTTPLRAREAHAEPTSRFAAVVDQDSALYRVDLESGSPLRAGTFVPTGLTLGVSPDGQRLWSGNGGVVRFHQVAASGVQDSGVSGSGVSGSGASGSGVSGSGVPAAATDIMLAAARFGGYLLHLSSRPDGRLDALSAFGAHLIVDANGVRLADGRPEIAHVAPTEPHAGLARVSAAVALSANTWLVGTTTGEVLRVQAGSPPVITSLTALPDRAAVDRLTPLDGPSLAELVIVESATLGPALVHRTTGAIVGRLPQSARGPFVVGPGGALLSFGSGRSVWQLDGPPRPRRITFDQGLGALAAAPSGRQVVAAGGGGLAVSVDTMTGAQTAWATSSVGVVKSVAFQPDGQHAVIARMGVAGAEVVSATTGAVLAGLPAPWSQRRVGWLADGVIWGLGYREPWRLWRADGTLVGAGPDGVEWRDGQSSPTADLALFLDDRGHVSRLSGQIVSPVATVVDAALIAVGPRGGFWTLRPGRLTGHDADGVERATIALSPGPTSAITSPVSALAVSPDGLVLVAGTFAGHIVAWTIDGAVPTRLATSRPHTDRVAALAFAGRDQSRTLWTASWDHRLTAIDLSSVAMEPDVVR